MRLRVLLSFSVIFAVFVCGSASAADLAELISLSGDVQVLLTDADEYVDAEEGVELSAGDRVKTGPNGKATISFNADNTNIVRLSEDSLAEIRSGGDEKLELSEGEAFASVSKLNSGSAFEIRTPTAVAGARGTDWVTKVTDDGTDVEAIDSTPYIKHIETGGTVSRQETAISPGQMSSVKRFQPPMAPRPMQAARLQQWKDVRPMLRQAGREALVRKQQRPAFDRAKFIEQRKQGDPGRPLRSAPGQFRPDPDRIGGLGPVGQGPGPLPPGSRPMLKEQFGTMKDEEARENKPGRPGVLQSKPPLQENKGPQQSRPQLPKNQKPKNERPAPRPGQPPAPARR